MTSDSMINFAQGPASITNVEMGVGRVTFTDGSYRLMLPAQGGMAYSNAQVDDYSRTGKLSWHAPVRLSIEARFSHAQHDLRGTCGFGFWNDPFGIGQGRLWGRWPLRVRLPQAAWFILAAPPSNLPWVLGVPGCGWKMATVDAGRWHAKLLLPLAPLGMLACRVKPMYVWLWPWIQRVLKLDEALVMDEYASSMNDWHAYRLDWLSDRVEYRIDGELLYVAKGAPHGPLGLVLWMDNQYMVATPQGTIRHGYVSTGEQWLELRRVTVEML